MRWRKVIEPEPGWYAAYVGKDVHQPFGQALHVLPFEQLQVTPIAIGEIQVIALAEFIALIKICFAKVYLGLSRDM